MPELIKLYIRPVLIGFALAAVFVALLIWTNVANLQHLIFNAQGGYLALFLLVFFNGIVFGGVQFAIAIMRMASDDDEPKGGKRDWLPIRMFQSAPAPIKLRADDAPR